MKKGSRKQRQGQIDEHNAPTEPLLDITAPYFPASDERQSPSRDRTASAPFSPYSNQRQPLPVYPYTQNPSSDVEGYPYPFLPGKPLGGNYGAWPGDAARNKKQHTRQRRFLLACVSLFFICLQLLLVVRFVIRLLSLSHDIAWVNVVTVVSEIFVLPFRAFWFQIPSVGTVLPANIELYTLIAILIYGVLSRLLVGILKLIPKSR
jgi:hypothetical protein